MMDSGSNFSPYRFLPHLVIFMLTAAPYAVGLWALRDRLESWGVKRISHETAAIAFAFAVLDGVLLAALTPLGLSYGPIGLALFAFVACRLFLAALLTFSLRRPGRGHLPLQTVSHLPAAGLAVLLALNLGLLAVEVDGFYIEPFALGVTEISAAGPEPLTIVHLTDLHVERITRREREMLAIVQAVRPDLIVLTGDYLNQEYLSDPLAQRETRQILAQLDAPLGVFAVSGSIDTPLDMAAIFEGLPIRVLNDETVRLPLAGGDLYLVGVSHQGLWRDRQALTRLMADIPPQASTLLLYHTPDLIESAAAEGVDIYLAGHTHGGQIRLPFYGAIITFSHYGKRYEMGEYHLGPTRLYVSRGIGLEGLGLPRVRFLCPPEIVVLQLQP